ncbi:MAG: DNA polymerase III subunit gamma/tau [Gemmatimonadales bacterium]|nr:DNA polymerase III subunit gamma/tau [Gemmatimonadales bacterium]
MIALARKYRPRRFADLLVQDHVAAALSGAVARNRVGHGYLLTGPRGVGKTTAARILAMALNCERQDPGALTGEPCGECPTCERIWGGAANLDVVEIDAASNRSVDDARDLRERAMYAASQENRYKVYIVDEAHMLTREAWNALLKILEEPPPRVVFVFATTEPQKIANTAAPVLSRLQRFDFKRIGVAAIRERVGQVLAAEGVATDDDAVTVIARYADGGMRDALSVLDQALSLAEGPLTAARVRQALGLISDELYAEVLDAVARKDAAAIFPVVDALLAAGADLVEFVNGMAELLRAVLMMATGAEPEGLTAAQREVIAAARERLAAGDVLRMLGLLTQAEISIRRSANPRLVVETLLLRWALMDRTVDLEAVLQGQSGSGGPPESGPAARPAAPSAARSAAARPAATREASAASAPVARPAPGPVLSGPLTPAGLIGVWPEVVVAARQRGSLAAMVAEHLTPGEIAGDSLTLILAEDQVHLLEGAERQRPQLEAALTEVLGRPVQLKAIVAAGVPAAAPAPDPAPAQPRKRLSEKDLRGARLRELRAKDSALDAAADALDLEIVD